MDTISVSDARRVEAVGRQVRLQGWVGQSNDSFQRAIDLIASRRYPVEKLRTHVYGFDQLGTAIDVLSGNNTTEKAINVVVTPTGA